MSDLALLADALDRIGYTHIDPVFVYLLADVPQADVDRLVARIETSTPACGPIGDILTGLDPLIKQISFGSTMAVPGEPRPIFLTMVMEGGPSSYNGRTGILTLTGKVAKKRPYLGWGMFRGFAKVRPESWHWDWARPDSALLSLADLRRMAADGDDLPRAA